VKGFNGIHTIEDLQFLLLLFVQRSTHVFEKASLMSNHSPLALNMLFEATKVKNKICLDYFGPVMD
jgi:hypothetical protein